MGAKKPTKTGKTAAKPGVASRPSSSPVAAPLAAPLEPLPEVVGSPVSEWNGRSLWPHARRVFETLNALAVTVRDGSEMGDKIGDDLDGLAWMINRNDVAAIDKVTRVNRTWLKKAHPLLSDRELARDWYDRERLAVKSDSDAYDFALRRIEPLVQRKLDAMTLAKSIARCIVAPLPKLGVDHIEELASKIERMRTSKSEKRRILDPDHRNLLNLALRIGGGRDFGKRQRALDKAWSQRDERKKK